jgi:hypothetical protein
MTRLFQLAAVLWLALVPMAQAQDAAIQGVIESQIEAFKADDFATAFTFASPAIKGIFGTPERFGQMVRQGYPMVHRPAEVRFLELREVAGQLWQRVMMTDAAGKAHFLDYQMIETPEGWQINGVQLLEAAAVGA